MPDTTPPRLKSFFRFLISILMLLLITLTKPSMQVSSCSLLPVYKTGMLSIVWIVPTILQVESFSVRTQHQFYFDYRELQWSEGWHWTKHWWDILLDPFFLPASGWHGWETSAGSSHTYWYFWFCGLWECLKLHPWQHSTRTGVFWYLTWMLVCSVLSLMNLSILPLFKAKPSLFKMP